MGRSQMWFHTFYSFYFRCFNNIPLNYPELQNVDCSFNQFANIDIRANTMGLPPKSTKNQEVLPVRDVCKFLNPSRMVPEKKNIGQPFPECLEKIPKYFLFKSVFPNDLHRTPPNDPRVPPTLQSAGPRVPTHHLGWTKHHCEWHFCWTVKFSKLNLEMFFPKKSPLTNSTPLKSATSDKIPSCKVTHRHWTSRIFLVNTINKWWGFPWLC